MVQAQGLREEWAAARLEIKALEARLLEVSGSASSLADTEMELRRQVASQQVTPSSNSIGSIFTGISSPLTNVAV